MEKKILLVLLVIGTIISFGNAQTPEYPIIDPSPLNGPYEGRGEFSDGCNMPGFDYEVGGQFATTTPNDNNIPGVPQVIENNAAFDAIFGPASFQTNIEVEVAGYGNGDGVDGSGDPITNTVETTLRFDSPTPPGGFGFVIADVEQDQVIICALDENGVAVPNSVIDGWFQYAFDADGSNNDGSSAPSWDAANATLVGELSPTPVQQTVYTNQLGDNEAGAAAFIVNTSITELTLKSQAIGVAPDDPSQHFIFASTCPCEGLAGVVFEDPNNDGCDAGGAGVPNVPVELFLCNDDGTTTLVATTTTGTDGSYAFDNTVAGGSQHQLALKTLLDQHQLALLRRMTHQQTMVFQHVMIQVIMMAMMMNILTLELSHANLWQVWYLKIQTTMDVMQELQVYQMSQ